MKLTDRIKAATGIIIRGRNLREPIGFSPRLSSDIGERVGEAEVLGMSAVWACCNLLSGTISSLPLMVYKNIDGRRQVDVDHPLYRILHNSPNFDQTALDFWDFTVRSVELWGNSYAEISRNSGVVTGLSPINPDTMKVSRSESGALQYEWKVGQATYKKPDTDILHVRGFGGAPLGGLSVLHFARNSFGGARAVEKSSSAMFANRMSPGGVLTFQNFLSDENRKIAEDRLTQKFVGALNDGRPMILEGGTKWEPITINPDDAQMLETRRFSVEDICRFFNVPPQLIGHTEKSSSIGTGIEQQTLAFQKFTLRPRIKRIEQALMQQLLTPDDIAAGVVVEFNIDGLLRGDSKSRSDFYNAGLLGGWLNINEIRKRENMEPVDGGDVNRTQMQNVPIAEIQNGNDD